MTRREQTEREEDGNCARKCDGEMQCNALPTSLANHACDVDRERAPRREPTSETKDDKSMDRASMNRASMDRASMDRARCGGANCDDKCDDGAGGEIHREYAKVCALPALAREVHRAITYDRTNRSTDDRTAEVHREIKIEDVARSKEHAERRTDPPPRRNQSRRCFGAKTRARREFPARA